MAEGPADDRLGNALAQQGGRQMVPKEMQSLSIAKGLSDAGRAHDPRCDVAQTLSVQSFIRSTLGQENMSAVCRGTFRG